MDKPRQRPTALKENLIIDQPSLQTLWQKYSYGIFTLLAWSLWLYLWLPLINLIAWLLGFKVFYQHMIVLGGYVGFLQLLGIYFVIILLIGTTLLSWALYNQIRFRGKDRREAVPPATNEDVARFFGVNEEDLQSAQKTRRLVISFDEENESIQILKQ